jgi:hypothetical protein
MDASNNEDMYLLAEDPAMSVLLPSTAARWMKIRVRRNGNTVVELTHPASAVERLSAMLDDGLKSRISAHGVDLVELAADTRRRGFQSGPLFAMSDGCKDVEVWLE